MSRITSKASAIAVAASILTILVSADGSGAAAESKTPVVVKSEPVQLVSQPVVQPLPEEAAAPKATIQDPAPAAKTDNDTAPAPRAAGSLLSLVNSAPQPAELSRELNCLAGAIYFEAKSESLPGQLAVGRVIVARSKSGRFPSSYCGVVFQRSQFSFVRGNAMPVIAKASRQWKNAVAMAQIAHEGSWQSPVEGALYFHAARVSPGWRLTRMARVDNHVFYR